MKFSDGTMILYRHAASRRSLERIAKERAYYNVACQVHHQGAPPLSNSYTNSCSYIRMGLMEAQDATSKDGGLHSAQAFSSQHRAELLNP